MLPLRIPDRKSVYVLRLTKKKWGWAITGARGNGEEGQQKGEICILIIVIVVFCIGVCLFLIYQNHCVYGSGTFISLLKLTSFVVFKWVF